MDNTYPFELMELPYGHNGLEPYIDTRTVKIHHTKHHKKYVDKLNTIISKYPIYQNWSLEKLLLRNNELPKIIREDVWNNAGGVYNHNLYFDIMRPPIEDSKPIGNLSKEIVKSYGSLDKFYELFGNAASNVFGSGYAWLVVDKNKKLKIVQSKNQDVPLNVFHVILIDVWEHAYYLKYQNKRDEYIKNWYNLIDWNKAEKNYKAAIDYF